MDSNLVDRITKPYTFIKLDTIIGNIRKQYVDTRTQANLCKLNAHRQKDLDLDIATEELSLITERRRRSEMIERMMEAHISTSPIWESKRLEHPLCFVEELEKEIQAINKSDISKS